jgi:Phage terminase large subunit (GpA)
MTRKYTKRKPKIKPVDQTGEFRAEIHADASKTNHLPWIFSVMADAFRLKFDGTIDQWADGKLKLPSSTRYPVYVAEESPWLIEPLRALSDPAVKRVDVRGPAGCAKSLIGEIFICYVVENEPGFTYYVHQEDTSATDAVEDRLMPMFEQNEFLANRLPTEPNKKRKAKILFPTMPFYALGANYNNAQSKRVRYLIMEEPHTYAAGMMTAFEKRTEGVRGAKVLTLSTGSIKGDESDKSFEEGTCELWHVPCPHCKHMQVMEDTKDRLRCDRTPETVDEAGDIIWSKLLATVRYNCVKCGIDWPTDEAFRREQAQSGRYIATNPNAAKDHRTFHLEAQSVHWMRLDDIVKEKLRATFAAKRGSTEMLQDYMQKRRAIAWDESPPDDGGENAAKMKGAYFSSDLMKPGADEIARFMTVDNQHGRSSIGEGAHRWVLVRAYYPNESKMLFAGRVTTWEEVEALRIKYGVQSGRTLVDTAFDSVNVQSQCVRYGWQALWGDTNRKDGYPHREMIMGQVIVRVYPFSTVQLGSVGQGGGGKICQARYFWWAHRPIKNLYHRLKGGMVSYRWTVPQDCPDTFFEHIKNEYKRQEVDNAGNKVWQWYNPPKKDNHLLDCDQMNLVAALMDPAIRCILLTSNEQHEKDTSTGSEDAGAKAT